MRDIRPNRFSAAALALLLLGALAIAVPAQAADPIDDILGCNIYVGHPSLADYQVTGFGGSSGCGPTLVGVLVCVDYIFPTQPASCSLVPPNEGGESNPVPCLPGPWMTQATPMGMFGPIGSSVHSLPPRVFVGGCLDPTINP